MTNGPQDAEIAAAIRGALVEGQLACAAAFRVAEALGVEPLAVGRVANEIGVRLSRCQLGLFGYGSKAEGKHRILRPMERVPDDLREAIEAALEGGGLRCAAAWEIAACLKRPKMDVSNAAEALGVRITYCQLGAFPR